MDINTLRSFVLVAKEGNLTKAAARLYTSQPAISVQIKALEEELGAKLFVRSNKGMRLTPSGTKLLQHAEEVLHQVTQLKQRADELKGSSSGALRVGTISSASLLRLSELLMRFSTDHKNVSIQLERVVSNDIRTQLKEGGLDFGFVYGDIHDSEIQVVPLCDVKLNIVGPSAWEDRIENATWLELVALPWVCPPISCPFREVLEKIFVNEGARPAIYIEAGEESTLKELAQQGVGLTVLRADEAKAAFESDQVAIWRGAEIEIGLSFCYLREREQEPIVRAVATMVRKIWDLPGHGLSGR